MFTGLVDAIGTIDRVTETSAGREFLIRSPYDDLADGESVAVNGACLTVRDRADGRFTVAAVVTTLGRTTMGSWTAGKRVNLERALKASDRLGGHIVQGHVDGVGTVQRVWQFDDAVLVDVAVPREIGELLVPHGSITVEGVSLTVNAIPEPSVVQLSLIEYTLRHTTLGDVKPGDAVHVEGDVIGKYVRQLMTPYLREQGTGNGEPRLRGASVPGSPLVPSEARDRPVPTQDSE
jgi:riboflavin synthase